MFSNRMEEFMSKILHNKFTQSIFFVFLIVILSFVFFAFSGGITGKTKKNGNGCTCHGSSQSNNVNVLISGPSSLSPNEKGVYRVTISGGPLVRAGVNIASSSGSLNPISSSNLQKIGDELTHISPKAPSGNEVSFDFEFTAPSEPGQITLFASGNSVNFDRSISGDEWNFASNFTVTVTTTNVENGEISVRKFQLHQNFPNPFNPSTTISYMLKEPGYTILQIYDLLGNEISTLINEFQNAGEYRYEFDASKLNLSSGTYIYKLSSNGEMQAKKFVYLK